MNSVSSKTLTQAFSPALKSASISTVTKSTFKFLPMRATPIVRHFQLIRSARKRLCAVDALFRYVSLLTNARCHAA